MDVAILIILFDERLEHVPACLESLHRTLPPRWRGEVLLLDNTARPGLAPALPRPGWRAIRPAAPLGLAAARNAAVATAAAGARTLCFVDPGTVLLPGWLPPMLGALARAPRAGCVANLQREPFSGLIDHAGVRFRADGFPILAGNLALVPPDPFDRWPAVSLACAVLRRGLYELVGGCNERYRGGLGDTDFCLRAAQAGYRHYVCNRSVVYHHADPPLVTNDSDPDARLFRLRWAGRAAASLRRRAALRQAASDGAFSHEQWHLAREARRLERLSLQAVRRDGHRYLGKHLGRPWRYNYGRVCHALGQALHSLPPPLPPPPHDAPDHTRPDDGWLFDPPPQ